MEIKVISSDSLKRLKRDFEIIENKPVEGAYIFPRKKECNIIDAVILGPNGTSFYGGLFCFVIRFPYNYPFYPPAVYWMNSDERLPQSVFNENGRLCLSFFDNDWTPRFTISDILMAIQTYLNETQRFVNNLRDAKRVNDVIRHECLRIAVCGIMEMITKKSTYHLSYKFIDLVCLHFRDHYSAIHKYVSQKVNIDGEEINFPLVSDKTIFAFEELKHRLEAIYNSMNKNVEF